MKKIDFDEYAADYDKLLKNQLNFFSNDDKYFAKYKIDLVYNDLDFKPNRILEYGCGTGRNLPYLKEKFTDAKIFGADISEKSIEVAKKQNSFCDFFSLNDNLNQDFLGSFDLIFVAGVFHHIHPNERLIVLEKIKSLLSFNGYLFIFEHNPYKPLTRKLVRECPFDADAMLLSKSETIELLKKTDYNIYNSKYCLFVPPKFYNFLKLEKYLDWLPLGGQYFIKAKKF